jgi:endonuclease/exonuclease/phosphatase family metal-dependent hydrolase
MQLQQLKQLSKVPINGSLGLSTTAAVRQLSARLRFIGAIALVPALFIAPAHARTLRVLTYNIHHSEGSDGAFDLARIADVITAANPDIVALQELDQGNARSGVNVFQLDQLAQLTGMQGFFGKTIDYQGGAYGNGILMRSNLHATGVVNRAIPSPVGGEGRGILEVGVSLDGDDGTPEFNFYATHFTNGSTAAAMRLEQATFVNSLVSSSTIPAIIGGDFNAAYTSTSYQRLSEQWQDPTAANPIYPRNSQIDFVFHRRPGAWTVDEPGVFIVNAATRVASDHFPYAVTLELATIPEPSAAVMAEACGVLMMALRRQRNCTGVSRCASSEASPRATRDVGAYRVQRGRRFWRRSHLNSGNKGQTSSSLRQFRG